MTEDANYNKIESVDESLIDSIAMTHMKGLGADAGELALDALLQDDLLQSIPVVNTVARLYQATISIRDHLFLRKVVSFLCELADIDPARRQHFAAQLVADSGSRARAGAALTLLLDRLDDLDKPSIVGRLYRARLEHKISFDELRRYCMIVERAHLPDLFALSQLTANQEVDEIAAPYLYALGLASITGEDYGTLDGVGAKTWYQLSEPGKRFLSIAFEDQDSAKASEVPTAIRYG